MTRGNTLVSSSVDPCVCLLVGLMAPTSLGKHRIATKISTTLAPSLLSQSDTSIVKAGGNITPMGGDLPWKLTPFDARLHVRNNFIRWRGLGTLATELRKREQKTSATDFYTAAVYLMFADQWPRKWRTTFFSFLGRWYLRTLFCNHDGT